VVAHVKVVSKVVVRKPVLQPPPRPRPALPAPHPNPRPRLPRRRWAPYPHQHRHQPPCGDRAWRREHDDNDRDDRAGDRRDRDD
jgi:hypothetical protein